MICYRDMTFCRVECENIQCPRHMETIPKAADGSYATNDLPISMGTFHDPAKGVICPKYIAPFPRGEN
jgi:hypothetical protein